MDTKYNFMKTPKHQNNFNLLSSLKILIILFVIVFSSCQESSELAPNDDVLKKKEAFNQVAEILQNKYFITSTWVNEDEYSFRFPDGRILSSKLENGKWVTSGSAVNNKIFMLPEIKEKDFSEFEGSNLQKFFRSNIGNDLLVELANKGSDESNLRIQQCVNGESFDQCFVREATDFCDGFLGCVTIWIMPGTIAVMIAAHCVACPTIAA